jgi:hypothetical protein
LFLSDLLLTQAEPFIQIPTHHEKLPQNSTAKIQMLDFKMGK